MRARGNRAAVSFAIAGLVLVAVGAAGCSSRPATSQPSVGSCVQFAEAAIRQHVTVTSLPPACRGLTAAQVNAAAGTALRSAGSGVTDKALRRERTVAASQYLAHMFAAVPAAGTSVPPLPATAAAGWVSRTTWGLLALGSWLVTIALGLGLMARPVLRDRARRPAGRRRRPPALNLAHLGLAGVSLLAWVVYLATAVTGVAWAAAGLLPLVAGLGMALLFLSYAAAPAASPGPAGDPGPGGRAPVVIVGAHVVFATATILFAVLAAIGTG